VVFAPPKRLLPVAPLCCWPPNMLDPVGCACVVVPVAGAPNKPPAGLGAVELAALPKRLPVLVAPVVAVDVAVLPPLLMGECG
jgi:hypothetical protein